MSDNQHDGAAVPASPEQLIEVAREVTRQLAPDELPKFDDAAAAWSSDLKRRPKRAQGPRAGFGLESPLLCELLFPIITGAVGQVLGTAAMERIRPRRRGRHAAGAQPGEQLTSKQAQQFHGKCQELARAEQPPAEPAQLADTIIDTLRRDFWRSRQ
jgi:hypothetical protein